ncbi:MAG: FixH family protein [Owenweeksia sp.]|nr:FixH family protein [Owenweeksia sp.]
MKLNWGTGIAIVLILFAISMGYAVYKAVQQNYDLVTTDYYAEELAYQEKIDQKKNGLALKIATTAYMDPKRPGNSDAPRSCVARWWTPR